MRYLTIAFLFICAGIGLAQIHVPAKGSAERKTILDTMRVTLKKDIGKSMIFEVKQIKAKNGYCFVKVMPLDPKTGKLLDFHGTKYQEAINNGAFDWDCWALLKRIDGKWKTLDFAVGPT